MNNTDKTIKLSNGVEIPRVGLGVWRIDNSMVSEVVTWALEWWCPRIVTWRS